MTDVQGVVTVVALVALIGVPVVAVLLELRFRNVDETVAAHLRESNEQLTRAVEVVRRQYVDLARENALLSERLTALAAAVRQLHPENVTPYVPFSPPRVQGDDD